MIIGLYHVQQVILMSIKFGENGSHLVLAEFEYDDLNTSIQYHRLCEDACNYLSMKALAHFDGSGDLTSLHFRLTLLELQV